MDSIKNKLETVSKDTEEIITSDELKNLLENKKIPESYWGIAPTGPPHIGYYRAISKQIDLLNAGFNHKILIATLHAYLDDRKSEWEELELRGKVYEICLKKLGLDNGVEYIFGHEFQFSEKYVSNFYRMMPYVTVKRATRAASTVCRMTNPKVSEIIYPLMQNIDFVDLEVDVAYGGIDQRHVYMLGREYLGSIGAKKPILVFTPLGLSLSGKEKMSASNKQDRLELFAEPNRIKKVIKSAFCPQNEIEGNPIIEYVKHLIFPRVNKLVIERDDKYGGDMEFMSFEELSEDYKKGNLHPYDLKISTAKYLIQVLEPIRKYFEKHSDMLEVFTDEL